MILHRWFAALAVLASAAAAFAAGDAARGAQAFRACSGCHSLAPGDHRTGPSLAGVFGRRAGTADGFGRYSEALRKSGMVWNAQALDGWLRDPAAFIAGNGMTFPGLPDARVRADLIAYLQAVSAGKIAAPKTPGLPDLRAADAGDRVSAIAHCGDTYRVTLGDGTRRAFWEFNLRFKTDSSAHGPRRGQPVIVGAGMGGDRAQVVFAEPAEISSFIRSHCE
ncbi:c-type cytochrome [Aromatoleum toluvorans]|uniref:C-type cytochrome n=1 Tax=Aromatoleum toluvorans TaxID=92002 RepID=A0ABX1Q4J3_9RHOO|nr:c-type cytochrome [Aromatoleum toluvorans]NMG45425.1 c-type cytochrome [Aromatoleum toluvorans]